MTFPQRAALLAACVLATIGGLHLLLAAGAPLGRVAWGGQYRVLPRRLRWGSAAAAPILGAAAWVALARVGVTAPGPPSAAVRLATWVFAGLFALNTLGNLASRSRAERYVMTPATLLLVARFLAAARAAP